MTAEAPQLVASKGVILVSEAFTEINAGLVIVLASGHQGPLQELSLLSLNGIRMSSLPCHSSLP